MSLYGDYLAFKTKEDRDYFIENYYDCRFRDVISCTIRTGRKYSLGMTVDDYNEYIEMLDFYDMGS